MDRQVLDTSRFHQ